MDTRKAIEERIGAYFSQKFHDIKNCTKISTDYLIRELGLFLTIKDIQELLKVSRPVVEKYIREQSLPAAKIGNQYRIRTADFIEWWDEQVAQGRKDMMKGLF